MMDFWPVHPIWFARLHQPLKISCMSESVFREAFRVLTLISFDKNESFISGALSIAIYAINSRLILVAALKNLPSTGSILLIPKKLFFT